MPAIILFKKLNLSFRTCLHNLYHGTMRLLPPLSFVIDLKKISLYNIIDVSRLLRGSVDMTSVFCPGNPGSITRGVIFFSNLFLHFCVIP